MPDIYLDWPANDGNSPGGDLMAGPDGDLLIAAGDTETRQRVVRRMLSKSRRTLPNGIVMPGDCVSDQNYGENVPAMIGGVYNADWLAAMQQLVRNGCAQDADVVAQSPPPDIVTQSLQGGVQIGIRCTSTQTGNSQIVPLTGNANAAPTTSFQ